ncbi:hypothetical protein V6N12_011422 [Hibiscus sabdariffa]|uniref:RUN domain-containing protein n=1 Tax=Hibiscus sabdariffa TaxID=183260 RepID=A0ABR2AWP5_9ROSI
MLPHETNTHATFASTVADEAYKQVLHDLCIEGTQRTKTTLGSKVVKWLQLKSDPKLWIYFMNTRLMSTGHHSMISRKRMLLLHSVLEERYIDDVAIAPGATPDHMLASFVALLRLYFQYVQQRRKAMGTLLKELLLQTSVVLPSLPEELLGDNVVAPPDDTQQPSPSLPEVVPTTPNSTQGKTVPQQKRNTTVRQKLNFSYDAQAFSPPPKKAKAKVSSRVASPPINALTPATTLTQVTIPKKTRTKNTARREPQLPREFYEKVGSISTSFESTNSLSTHAPDVTPTPSAPAPIGCRVQRKAAKII